MKAREQAQSHSQNNESSANTSVVNQAVNQQQLHDSTSSTQEQQVDWCGCQIGYQFSQGGPLQDWIHLDSASTCSICSNPSYLTQLKTIEHPLNLSTNGGILCTNQQVQIPKFGNIWYAPKAVAIILSMAELEDRYCIMYDLAKEKAFVIHLPD